MSPSEVTDKIQEIAEKIAEGKIIPFVGAGATQRADGKCPPTGGALCNILARGLRYTTNGTSPLGTLPLATLAQHFELRKGRPELIELLKQEIANRDFLPSPVYSALARIVKHFPDINLIITTNYDNLMDRSLGPPLDKPFEVLVQFPYRPCDDAGYRCPKGSVAVYKIHGGLERLGASSEKDSLVITEDDYLEFLANIRQAGYMPYDFLSRISNDSFLFLGYGLQDWDFMVLYKSLIESKTRTKIQRSFTVQKPFVPDGAEKLSFWENTKEYWSKKNIVTLEIDQEEFMKALLAKLGISDGEG